MSSPAEHEQVLVLQAARFACERHAGQDKPRQQRSTIDHCVEVGILVAEAGLPASAVAAALLHDTLEKTATTRAELEARFGPRVGTLVAAVTDAPSDSEAERLARLKAAPPEAQSIKCADIVSNLEALQRAGALTAKDAEKKGAALDVLGQADARLTKRAAAIIARGRGATEPARDRTQ